MAEEVQAGAKEPFHILQSAIILNDIAAAVNFMHQWAQQSVATSERGAPRPRDDVETAIYLRVFSHMIICWR